MTSLLGRFTPVRRVSLTYVAFFGAVGAVWPYLPIFYSSLGLNLDQVGLVMAIYSGAQLIASPLWGALADRFYRSRATLPAAAVVAIVGATLLALATDLPGTMLGVLVLATGLAGIGPVVDGRSIELLGDDRIRYGQLRGWGSLSFVFVAVLVGLLLDRAGIHAMFGVYIPLLAVTALITSLLPRAARIRTDAVRPSPRAIVRAAALRNFFIAAFIVYVGLNAISAFFSLGLTRLGGNNADVGVLWAIGALIEVPIMFGYGHLARRFGASRLLIAGAILFAVRAVFAALATEPWMLIATSPIEGIGYGLFFTGGVGWVASRAPDGLTATAQGVYTAVGGLAAITGALLGGAIAAATSLPIMFAVCGVGGFVGAGMIWLATRGPAGSAIPLEALPVPIPILEEERLA